MREVALRECRDTYVRGTTKAETCSSTAAQTADLKAQIKNQENEEDKLGRDVKMLHEYLAKTTLKSCGTMAVEYAVRKMKPYNATSIHIIREGENKTCGPTEFLILRQDGRSTLGNPSFIMLSTYSIRGKHQTSIHHPIHGSFAKFCK